MRGQAPKRQGETFNGLRLIERAVYDCGSQNRNIASPNAPHFCICSAWAKLEPILLMNEGKLGSRSPASNPDRQALARELVDQRH
jgi:hypothetical protein